MSNHHSTDYKLTAVKYYLDNHSKDCYASKHITGNTKINLYTFAHLLR